MTLERRTGGDSSIFIGRQAKYGDPIIGDTVFWGQTPDWSDRTHITARLITQRFLFVRNTLDPTSETAESESITGANAAVPPILTARAGGGEWEFEVLPGDAIHLLLGWFNPEALPAPTAVTSFAADNHIPAAKIRVSGTKLLMDNAPETSGAHTGKILARADWPGRLHFTGNIGLTGAGTVVINGSQRRSRSNKFNAQTFETAAVADGATVDFTSQKFYNQIHELDFIGFTGTTLTKPELSLLPDTHAAVLELHPRNAVFGGWTSQMVKAAEPFIAYDIIPDSFRFTVSAGAMRLVLTLLASFVQEGRVLIKPLAIAYKLPTYDRPPNANSGDLSEYEVAASATDANFPAADTSLADQTDKQGAVLERYAYASTDFYPSYGTAVMLGNPGESLAALHARHPDPIPITNIETVGSHNYTNAEGFTGDPVGGPPVTDENQTRTVNVNATIVHQTDTQTLGHTNATPFWQDRYFEGQYIPIIVHSYAWNGPGRQSLIVSEFPHCKLTAVPGLPIDGSGPVNRQLAFQAYPTPGATRPDEIKMTFYSRAGYKE